MSQPQPVNPPTYPSPVSSPPVDYPLGDQPTASTEQVPPSTQNNPWNPPSQSNTPTISPLDNPWGVPSQPPPLDGSTEPSIPPPTPSSLGDQPTFQPTSPPSWSPQPLSDQPMTEQNVTQTEPAPTDLSHLINNNGSTTPLADQPMSAPSTNGGAETLVAPSNGTPDVPTLPTEDHKGFPKWTIGVGIGLLIIVVGASAYFILGIGQPKTTTSVPAETAPVSQQVKPPAPIPTPVAQPTPVATGSANFGQLQGSGTQQATSAADLIRQRQQQQTPR